MSSVFLPEYVQKGVLLGSYPTYTQSSSAGLGPCHIVRWFSLRSQWYTPPSSLSWCPPFYTSAFVWGGLNRHSGPYPFSQLQIQKHQIARASCPFVFYSASRCSEIVFKQPCRACCAWRCYAQLSQSSLRRGEDTWRSTKTDFWVHNSDAIVCRNISQYCSVSLTFAHSI